MVVWIIGKSGSGKSFFAHHLYKKVKSNLNKVFLIDGDRFRKRYSKDLGYSIQDRMINSKRVQNFCKKLENRGYLTICSILSISTNDQTLNRSFYQSYLQIEIDADLEILKKRNNKKIYDLKKNIVGIDIHFPKPRNSDFILKNKFDESFLEHVKLIEKYLYEKL